MRETLKKGAVFEKRHQWSFTFLKKKNKDGQKLSLDI